MLSHVCVLVCVSGKDTRSVWYKEQLVSYKIQKICLEIISYFTNLTSEIRWTLHYHHTTLIESYNFLLLLPHEKESKGRKCCGDLPF